MLSIESLGAHSPTALEFLISESILPENPAAELYSWKIYNDGLDLYGEEEVVITDRCVVWSQNGVICRVFKYDGEDERVTRALLTWFEHDGKAANQLEPAASSSTWAFRGGSGNIDITSQAHNNPSSTSHEYPEFRRSRALVVFLREQAHIYHLHGASHIVNLPFEVEQAYPTPRGLLLQRKISIPETIPPTPMPPLVPFNTFVASQTKHPSVSRSRAPGELTKGRKVSTNLSNLPRSLSDFFVDHAPPVVDTLPRFFTLTDPVAEMGVAVQKRPYSSQMSSGEESTTNYTIEQIDQDEEVIYISSSDELSTLSVPQYDQLILVLTISRTKQMYTLWTASYVDFVRASVNRSTKAAQSAPLLPKSRTSLGARRSMISETAGVTLDRGRESFANISNGSTSFTNSQSVRRHLDQAQYDGTTEIDLAASISAALDSPEAKHITNRRTSSILARAELPSHDQATSNDISRHQPTMGGGNKASSNRGQSFGGSTEPVMRDRMAGRRVTAERRSQLLGLTTSLSHGTVDESMVDDAEPDHGYDVIENLFPIDAFNRLRKEMVMERIFSKALGNPFESHDISQLASPDNVEVFTLARPPLCSDVRQRRRSVSIFVMNKAVSILSAIYLDVVEKPAHEKGYLDRDSQPESASKPGRYSIENVEFQVYNNVIDAVKVMDGTVGQVLQLVQDEGGLQTIRICPARATLGNQVVSVRLPVFLLQRDSVKESPRWIAESHYPPQINDRTTVGLGMLTNAGVLGKFDAVDKLGQHHWLQVQLRPKNQYVAKILATCRLILRDMYSGENLMLFAWWWIRQKLESKGVAEEWNAMVIALFCFTIGCLDDGSHSPQFNLRSPEVSLKDFDKKSSTTDPALSWLLATFDSPTPPYLNIPEVSSTESASSASHTTCRESMVVRCVSIATTLLSTKMHDSNISFGRWLSSSTSGSRDRVGKLLVALHLLREEEKLNIMSEEVINTSDFSLAPVLAQIGHWLKWKSWSWESGSFYSLEDPSMQHRLFNTSEFKATPAQTPPFDPPSIFQWLVSSQDWIAFEDFPSIYSLLQAAHLPEDDVTRHDLELKRLSSAMTPRTNAIVACLRHRTRPMSLTTEVTEGTSDDYFHARIMETLPEAIVATLRYHQSRIPGGHTSLPSSMLENIAPEVRYATNLVGFGGNQAAAHAKGSQACTGTSGRDARSLRTGASLSTAATLDELLEADNMTKIIYRHDNRFVEARTLLNSRLVALGVYIPTEGLSEARFLDEQKAFAQELFKRTMSLPSGEALLGFCSHAPHPTQKIETPMFNTSCNIQPSNITVDVDKTPFGEDKAGWAYFHAGVAAGLQIAKVGPSIDTTWLTLNKPAEPGIRHAGLLLALGLNGHLKKMAKWLAFKYLTPKHDMTTIALLLGMAASYSTSMDTHVTRLLSVHVPRLLPPGAAELNLSPLTQTAGIMGIGLLYCGSQHRRMSEVMLSEIEHADVDDLTKFSASPGTAHRDEGYRLSAGFALGLINIHHGTILRTKHDDLRMVERLLNVATAPRDINVVHILDQAMSGATIALALIFMKTHDVLIANKIGVPETLRQLDYARPDILLLRTVARHLILWNDIEPTMEWIWKHLPHDFRKITSPRTLIAVPPRLYKNGDSSAPKGYENPLSTGKLPYYNILAGSCWSISLRYAGSGSEQARDCLFRFYDSVTKILELDGPNLTFDQRLTRNALQRLQHLLALSVATIMAGTGDLQTFRRLRVLHASVENESTFGFHQAAHMATGALFLGNGLYTFSTNDFSIAALLCAFYPIFPKDAMDNSAHLQAFRHFWAFAAEPRCVVARDADTHDAIVTPILVILRDGTNLNLNAPQLLPELETIDRVVTTSPEYHQVSLDLKLPQQLAHFRTHQTIFLRRKSLLSQYKTPFNVALATRREKPTATDANPFDLLFDLDILARLGISRAEAQSIFPRGPDQDEQHEQPGSSSHRNPVLALLDAHTTSIDDMLVLAAGVNSEDRDLLLGLRMLLEWAERERKAGRRLGWLSEEGVGALKAMVLRRARAEYEEVRRLEERGVKAMNIDV